MADQTQNPNYYTSVHSGVDIDAAISFGNIAQKIDGTYKPTTVKEADWTSNIDPSKPRYSYSTTIENQPTFPLVFFVDNTTKNRHDLDYSVTINQGGATITVFSNQNIAGTIYVAGFTGWNGG